MTDLSERVQSILDELGISARELARRAQLKSESHVGLMIQRKVTRPSADVLEAIAKAANVELAWLTSGKEPRRRGAAKNSDSNVTVSDERYEAMPAVRAMARAQGFAEEFVSKWEVHLDADDQPDADYLWTLCKADYARWSRKEKVTAGGDPLADLDGPRVRPARKKT